MTLFLENIARLWSEWKRARLEWRDGSGLNVIAQIAKFEK